MNKDCEIIKDLIPLYVDDVCSTETKEFVEKHLKNCNECQKIFAPMEKASPNKIFKNSDTIEIELYIFSIFTSGVNLYFFFISSSMAF